MSLDCAVYMEGDHFNKRVVVSGRHRKLHVHVCIFNTDIFRLRTFKKDCPAHISLRINGSGDALEVKAVSFDHNHERSEVR